MTRSPSPLHGTLPFPTFSAAIDNHSSRDPRVGHLGTSQPVIFPRYACPPDRPPRRKRPARELLTGLAMKRNLNALIEAVHREALRADFPIDAAVYERSDKDPTRPILFAGS